MLETITISNFAIIDNLALNFQSGMTALTGETGAGKSIIIDALQYALGARTDASMVRHGCTRADINVEFKIKTLPAALSWLETQSLDDGEACLLKRSILANGGSKQFINGQPCTQTQMRELASLLVTIHGQHDNHLLAQKNHQQVLLDQFAQSLSLSSKKSVQHAALLADVVSAYDNWSETQAKILAIQSNTQDFSAKVDLLNYQIQELEKLNLGEGEVKNLEQEHKLLIKFDDLSRDCHAANTILNSDTDANLGRLLNSCTVRLQAYKDFDPRLANTVKLLDEALIQVEEAQSDLESYISGLDLNPERLNYLETRLQTIHDLARKHKIAPEALNNKLKLLKEELDSIQHADAKLAELSIALVKFEQAYHLAAKHLSSSRKQAADLLNISVSKNIQLLGMSGGKFEVQLTPRADLHIKGQESIEFLVSANPGQPLRPIAKVASGGELSRMSLAIEVITADHTNTPTLIFDEVDVGIGGATAEIVGKLLRELGHKAQVFCITHLAQVAAQAHHHLQVSKTTDGQATHTNINYLNAEERIQEIARMLGGVKISAKSLAHAKELLAEID